MLFVINTFYKSLRNNKFPRVLPFAEFSLTLWSQNKKSSILNDISFAIHSRTKIFYNDFSCTHSTDRHYWSNALNTPKQNNCYGLNTNVHSSEVAVSLDMNALFDWLHRYPLLTARQTVNVFVLTHIALPSPDYTKQKIMYRLQHFEMMAFRIQMIRKKKIMYRLTLHGELWVSTSGIALRASSTAIPLVETPPFRGQSLYMKKIAKA